ncbi:5-oxoprolinase subunit C family protein [Alishewanella sp. HL-SH06]|uniref:5-oxoprolinase subunit C family protein n=1 Tax=Alishewanella sp. HL-SH06 TaxID=3461144 RepID=UPI004042C1C4
MTSMTVLRIISPGVLSLLQDQGRFGMGALGLTQGGPLDLHSFRWANALVANPINSTLIEHSVGGLTLQAVANCVIAVTGAELALSLNGKAVQCWQALALKAGDEIELGMCSRGLRAYIAVAGGIAAPAQFGSSATVMREGIGGLQQNGQKLTAGAELALATKANSHINTNKAPVAAAIRQRTLPGTTPLQLRLIEGYQAALFSATARAQFYLHTYQVSPQFDRMGYKLNGPAIRCSTSQLLSEGISYGAVQIPPDGQPIVLLNDRQTLGGYPKIGNVLSLDCWALAQASSGTQLNFSPITAADAHNATHLAAARLQREYQHYGISPTVLDTL